MRESGKVLASQDVTLKGDGQMQSETLVFNGGDGRTQDARDRRRADLRRREPANNTVTRLVNVETRKPRILYIEGEPRWEYKFIRRALDDYSDIELASMVRTTQNKIYRQVPAGAWPEGTGRRLSRPSPKSCSSIRG